MRQLGEAATEERIRELAKDANERVSALPGTQMYTTVLQLPAEHFPGILDARGFQRNMSFTEIRCDLDPRIAGTPEGQLIAEIIIRDAYDLAKMEQEIAWT